jgi:predicted nuclease of predicted toxin-antitoxin system
MIILLDENLLSKKLKQPFLNKGYQVYNVNDMGWSGLKDREILERAENQPFDIFITADKNLPYQQNLSNTILIVVILNTRSTNPNYLLPLMIKVSEFVPSLSGGIVFVDDDGNLSNN